MKHSHGSDWYYTATETLLRPRYITISRHSLHRSCTIRTASWSGSGSGKVVWGCHVISVYGRVMWHVHTSVVRYYTHGHHNTPSVMKGSKCCLKALPITVWEHWARQKARFVLELFNSSGLDLDLCSVPEELAGWTNTQQQRARRAPWGQVWLCCCCSPPCWGGTARTLTANKVSMQWQH